MTCVVNFSSTNLAFCSKKRRKKEIRKHNQFSRLPENNQPNSWKKKKKKEEACLLAEMVTYLLLNPLVAIRTKVNSSIKISLSTSSFHSSLTLCLTKHTRWKKTIGEKFTYLSLVSHFSEFVAH